jgi:SRSO17 transposase
MLRRALDACPPAAWVIADEVYGGNPRLRAWLEAHRLVSVMAVRCIQPLAPVAGSPAPAEVLAKLIPPERWLRLNAGDSAKGRRWYTWSRVPLSSADAPDGWERWLLIRRNLVSGEQAFDLCAAPAGLPLVALVKVAGTRWRVEESFQATMGLCGLDDHQVRR